MFTGIISDLGVLVAREECLFVFDSAYDPASIDLGASIACDGCCLTVTKVEPLGSGGARFYMDVSNETLACTTLGGWDVGQKINFERALKMGDEFGGHIVTGHVDVVVSVLKVIEDGDSVRFTFEVPQEIAGFIAPKGSVTLNGTSLTVNGVGEGEFDVNLIPHTLEVTSWGGIKADDKINLEVDVIARYVARQRIAFNK